jgi:hypothetical protein
VKLGQIWQGDGSPKTAVGQPANVGHVAGPAEVGSFDYGWLGSTTSSSKGLPANNEAV